MTPDQKTLRLLMTTDAHGWASAVNLACGLAVRGVQTVLVMLGQPPDAARRGAVLERVELVVLTQDRDLQNPSSAPGDIDVQGIRLAMMAVERRPDIVHLHTAALAANARFPCRLVVDCHAHSLTPPAEGGSAGVDESAWHIEMTARGCASADLVIASSAASAVEAQSAYGLKTLPRIVARESDARADDTLALYREIATGRQG